MCVIFLRGHWEYIFGIKISQVFYNINTDFKKGREQFKIY